MEYLLMIASDETAAPAYGTDDFAAWMAGWVAFSTSLMESGRFIAGAGLQPTATATTVRRAPGSAPTVVDGPYAETKEQLGGFYLITAADLDEALEWPRASRSPPAPSRSGRSRSGPTPGAASRATNLTSLPADVSAAVTRLARQDSGRVVALLAGQLRDLDLADESVQDALEEAVRTWPDRGIPDQPGRLAAHRRPAEGDRPAASRRVGPPPHPGRGPRPAAGRPVRAAPRRCRR